MSKSVVNEVINQDDVVLEAVNLQKYFPTGASKLLQRPTQLVQAVDGVSFSLRKGKTWQSWASPVAVNQRWRAYSPA